MRMLDITLKDLSQILRDRRALLFLVAMPIIFTLFMGFAYRSGSDNEASNSPVRLGWVNQDPDGLLSQQLHLLLQDSDSIQLVDLAPQAPEDAIRRAEVTAALLVPQGFSEQIFGAQKQLILLGDPASLDNQSLFQMLRLPVTNLMSSLEIARLSAETAGMPDDEAEIKAAFYTAAKKWQESHSTSLVNMQQAVVQEEEQWFGDNPYNQASPGILVQFAIFGLVTSGQILLQERKTRTLQRMRTTSLPAWQIVVGHLFAMFAVVFIQEALLVIFGQLALGVDYGREPLAVLLISLALGLWIAAVGLLVGVVAKDDSQVVLFSLLAMFFFSALGGTWFPLEASSGAFAAIGKLLPSAWAMTGFQNILLRGLGLASAWAPVLVLLAYALGFFLLAVWRLNKSEL